MSAAQDNDYREATGLLVRAIIEQLRLPIYYGTLKKIARHSARNPLYWPRGMGRR